MATTRPVARTAVATAAAVNVAGVVVMVVLGIASQASAADGLGPAAIGAVYLAPAVLALLALRGRDPLLVPAGLTALVLSVFPFSLHSFVLGPIGLIYLASYVRAPTPAEGAARSLGAFLMCPALVVAAFVVLLVHEDPVCYERRESGEVIIDRDPAPVESGSQTIGPDSEVVERGCTSDTVVWWEAAASLTLSGCAVAAGLVLVPRRSPGAGDDAAAAQPTPRS